MVRSRLDILLYPTGVVAFYSPSYCLEIVYGVLVIIQFVSASDPSISTLFSHWTVHILKVFSEMSSFTRDLDSKGDWPSSWNRRTVVLHTILNNRIIYEMFMPQLRRMRYWSSGKDGMSASRLLALNELFDRSK